MSRVVCDDGSHGKMRRTNKENLSFFCLMFDQSVAQDGICNLCSLQSGLICCSRAFPDQNRAKEVWSGKQTDTTTTKIW